MNVEERDTGILQTESISTQLEHPIIPRDLRELIECVQTEGRILHIDRSVSPEPEVQSFCRAASELSGTALLFSNILGYKDKRLLLNVLASWANCAIMAGLPSDASVPELIGELCRRADKKTHEPIWIEIEKAPVYECLEIGEIDLYKILPLFRINEHDGGFYLQKACVVSGDIGAVSKRDRMKFGMYSLQVQGRDKLGVHLSGTDNLSIHIQVAERMNRRLPVTVCLGVPPLASLAASAAIGYETAEYSLISALQKHPFELTKCAHSTLSVPAYSEYVLEGYIEPGVRCTEGPFTHIGGSFSGIKRQPQIVVTAIAHRSNPILDNAYVGASWTEHDCLVGIAAALRLHKQAKDTLPEIARSGVRAEGVHLRLDVCSGRERERSAHVSFQDKLPSEGNASAYKQEIEEARRKEERCHRRS